MTFPNHATADAFAQAWTQLEQGAVSELARHRAARHRTAWEDYAAAVATVDAVVVTPPSPEPVTVAELVTPLAEPQIVAPTIIEPVIPAPKVVEPEPPALELEPDTWPVAAELEVSVAPPAITSIEEIAPELAPHERRLTLSHVVMFLLLTVVWGSSFLWIDLALRGFTPALLLFLQNIFSIALILGYRAIRPRARAARSNGTNVKRARPSLRTFAVLAILAFGADFLLIWGQQRVDSGIASILYCAEPIWTVLIAHAVLGQRHGRSAVFSILLGITGVTLLASSQGAFEHPAAAVAMGAVLFSAILYGTMGLFSSSRLSDIDPLDVVLWSALGSAILSLPFAIGGLSQMSFEPAALLGLGVFALTDTVIGWYLYFRLVGEIGPTRTARASYSMPLIGVPLGAFFLDERIGLLSIVAIPIVLLALWVGGTGTDGADEPDAAASDLIDEADPIEIGDVPEPLAA